MYEKLNITENHLNILSLFTDGFDKEHYIREVQKILKISPRTAQLILDDLESKAVLESQTKGKIKVYRIKKSDIAEEYIIFAEQYKRVSFLQKHDIVREIIAKIAPTIKGIGIIFGSYAKSLEKKESDLDILIIGGYDPHEIKKVSKLYGREIAVKEYPLKLFKKNIKKDVLLKEVIGNHVVFLNAEQFIKMVLRNE